jgi:hypothetical protein
MKIQSGRENVRQIPQGELRKVEHIPNFKKNQSNIKSISSKSSVKTALIKH